MDRYCQTCFRNWKNCYCNLTAGNRRRKERKMETNAKAQAVLGLLAKTFTQLHEASKDGKVEVSEILKTVISIAPDVTALAGVDLGN